MYRPIPVEEVIAAMPKKRQEAIAKRGAQLVAKVRRRMILAELRKDPRLSTVQRTIAAMGGHLTLIATFPDQEPVVLIPSALTEKTTSRPERA
jgi:hypothetical protein